MIDNFIFYHILFGLYASGHSFLQSCPYILFSVVPKQTDEWLNLKGARISNTTVHVQSSNTIKRMSQNCSLFSWRKTIVTLNYNFPKKFSTDLHWQMVILAWIKQKNPWICRKFSSLCMKYWVNGPYFVHEHHSNYAIWIISHIYINSHLYSYLFSDIHFLVCSLE